MKKSIVVFVFLIVLMLCSCNSYKDETLVGKWVDDITGSIVEYTSDGYYYEYVNEGFTTDKTRYSANGKEISYYIEGEDESGYSLSYKIEKGKLFIADSLTYTKIENNKVEKK